MDSTSVSTAQNELLDAMKIIAEKYTKNQTRVYNGRVLSIAGNKANVSVNGVDYLLPIYGSNELSSNSIVKVVLPDGNMSQAFVLSSLSGGGGGTITIPIATTTTLGGVIVGNNLTVDGTGKISLDTSSLDLDDYLAKDELLQTTGTATTNTMSQNAITNSLDGKVNTEVGKGLSTNDFTTALMTKLNGISSGAEVNVQSNWNETTTTDDSYIQNKPTTLSKFTNDMGFITKAVGDLENYYDRNYVDENLVEQVSGKGLSENDFTDALLAKLNGISTGAEVNAQADWNETVSTDDSYIQNKPTALSSFTNDQGFITSTVNNLTNYYLSSNTYTKAEVNALVATIPQFSIEIVTALPTTDISTTTIYLVAKTGSTNDYYDEYIYVSGSWEILGSTQIDLSNYYTITQVDSLLANKWSKATALTNQDLDNYKSEAYYYAGGGNSVTNKPTGVDAFGMFVQRVASGYYTQILFSSNVNSGKQYYRTWTSSSWTSWQAYYNQSNPPTASIVGLGNVPNVSTNNQTPTFTTATTRTNILSGDTLSTLFGKASKWFTDLKTVAFTGSYSDLSDKPVIPEGSEVVDNLTSTSSTASLSANMGRDLEVSKLDKTGGVLSILGNQYITSGKYGIAMNNSDITKVNGIYFSDYSNTAHESLSFKRSDTGYDSVVVQNGKMLIYSGYDPATGSSSAGTPKPIPSIEVQATKPTNQSAGDFWYKIV